MVLVLAPCYIGGQDHYQERNRMFTIFYDNQSTSGNSTRYNRSYMTRKISKKNGLERRIDRTVSFSFS